ncbi:MAG: NADP-dependent malic enzyme [Acholeplasmataceae bacterium]|nr:NADP-dependent malic enzyme [Acholeplasmataceae bacterium]
MSIMEESLALHRKLKGKISVESKFDIKNKKDLSLVYTPGVASSCLSIKDNPEEAYELTSKNNTVAVISDGTAVLGLGDIGPLAAIPVMEGKCAIFKRFAGIDAIPIVLNTKDVNELVQTIYHLAPSFGGINLEDISAPRCFEVEKRLRSMLDIPVFHDDQHGTAIACSAALLNALKLVKKDLEHAKIVINGAGSAGIAISTFLLGLGAKNLIVCDKAGILDPEDKNLNSTQVEMARLSNKRGYKGSLSVVLTKADAFIGVSAGNIVSKEMVRLMNQDAVVFALANPTPEISRELALEAGARIYGAGISNIPNQINNALVFPGLFKGLLKARVKQIDTDMEIAACKALAGLVSDSELTEDYIIPDVFNENVTKAISEAIIRCQLEK